jgi:hypothetical protein
MTEHILEQHTRHMQNIQRMQRMMGMAQTLSNHIFQINIQPQNINTEIPNRELSEEERSNILHLLDAFAYICVTDTETDPCPICMDRKEVNLKFYECKHILCKECLSKAFVIKQECPLCRKEYKV